MRIDETVGGSRLRARSVSASRSETLLGASIRIPIAVRSRTCGRITQKSADEKRSSSHPRFFQGMCQLRRR